MVHPFSEHFYLIKRIKICTVGLLLRFPHFFMRLIFLLIFVSLLFILLPSLDLKKEAWVAQFTTSGTTNNDNEEWCN